MNHDKSKRLPKWILLIISIAALSLITFFLFDFVELKNAEEAGKWRGNLQSAISQLLQIIGCAAIGCYFGSTRSNKAKFHNAYITVWTLVAVFLLYYTVSRSLFAIANEMIVNPTQKFIPLYSQSVFRQFLVQKLLQRSNAFALFICEVCYFGSMAIREQKHIHQE